MSTIIRLDKNDYEQTKHLFKDIPFGWDVIFNTALEYGFVLANHQNEPKVALAFLGGCVIYGGDANHCTAKDLVSAMKIQPLILAHSAEWGALIKNVHGEKVKIETRYHLPFKSLDQDKLYSIDLSIPNGYRLEKINEEIAEKLKDEIGEEYQIYHYDSLKDFEERGCGFCITNGDEICSTAAAFLRSGNQIQIQVNTTPKYQQQGMATITSTTLLRYCMENGITADWDAANTSSRDLAYKLGYQECTPYIVLSILPE